MCLYLETKFIVKLKLSDNQKGNPTERIRHYELENRLIDIIESNGHGEWGNNHIEDGYFHSIFYCDDPDSAVRAIMSEMKKFKPRSGTYIDKFCETTEVDHVYF